MFCCISERGLTVGRLLTSSIQCTMNLCTKATIECCMLQSHIYPIPISTTDKHMGTSLACTSSTVVVWQHQWLLDWCFVSNHNCMDYYIIQFQSEHYTYWLIVFYQLCNNIVHWNCSPGQNLLVESAHNWLTNHVPWGHNTLADSVPLQQKQKISPPPPPPHTYTLAHTSLTEQEDPTYTSASNRSKYTRVVWSLNASKPYEGTHYILLTPRTVIFFVWECVCTVSLCVTCSDELRSQCTHIIQTIVCTRFPMCWRHKFWGSEYCQQHHCGHIILA